MYRKNWYIPKSSGLKTNNVMKCSKYSSNVCKYLLENIMSVLQ
jgi:hypothetical protein